MLRDLLKKIKDKAKIIKDPTDIKKSLTNNFGKDLMGNIDVDKLTDLGGITSLGANLGNIGQSLDLGSLQQILPEGLGQNLIETFKSLGIEELSLGKINPFSAMGKLLKTIENLRTVSKLSNLKDRLFEGLDINIMGKFQSFGCDPIRSLSNQDLKSFNIHEKIVKMGVKTIRSLVTNNLEEILNDLERSSSLILYKFSQYQLDEKKIQKVIVQLQKLKDKFDAGKLSEKKFKKQFNPLANKVTAHSQTKIYLHEAEKNLTRVFEKEHNNIMLIIKGLRIAFLEGKIKHKEYQDSMDMILEKLDRLHRLAISQLFEKLKKIKPDPSWSKYVVNLSQTLIKDIRRINSISFNFSNVIRNYSELKNLINEPEKDFFIQTLDNYIEIINIIAIYKSLNKLRKKTNPRSFLKNIKNLSSALEHRPLEALSVFNGLENIKIKNDENLLSLFDFLLYTDSILKTMKIKTSNSN